MPFELDPVAPLPPLYFPVSVDPAVAPSELLPPGTLPLASDVERAFYLARKRELTQRPGRGPQRAPGAGPVIAAAEGYLRACMSQLPLFHGQEAQLLQLDLDSLALELQEDVVLMSLPAGFAAERARAAYLHVCFPAGWNPSALVGKSFTALHARVPREPGFERADYGGHAALLFQQPSLRYVWSLTPDDELDRHPHTPRAASWEHTARAFLRVERQLGIPLEPIADGTLGSLFLLRTYIYPLTRLSASQRDTLCAAVRAMPESLRRYKGLLGHEQRVLGLVQA